MPPVLALFGHIPLLVTLPFEHILLLLLHVLLLVAHILLLLAHFFALILDIHRYYQRRHADSQRRDGQKLVYIFHNLHINTTPE